LNWVEQVKLTASDGAVGDEFGNSVSISGDYALVGAWGDDDNGGNAGSAYVFHYDGSTWVEQTKLSANDGRGSDFFGQSVSISGDYALVGAWGDEANVGAAYIFHYDGSTWVEQTKLSASDGAAFDNFGVSVSISGDYCIIGATGDDDIETSAGSAYVFMRNGTTWVEETKLTSNEWGWYNYFGASVSISGDYAIVGNYVDDGLGPDPYSAHVFHNDGSIWVEQAALTPSDGAGGRNWFGVTVSISGDYAIMGIIADDENGFESGP